MDDATKQNAALFIAMYASVASTVAITALKKDGLIDDAVFGQILESLEICRDFIGDDPFLVDHLARLEKLLADGRY